MAPSVKKLVADLSSSREETQVEAANRLAELMGSEWPPNPRVQAEAVRHGAVAALLRIIRHKQTSELSLAACSALVNLLLTEDAALPDANSRIELVWQAHALDLLMALIADPARTSAHALALLAIAALGYGPDAEAAVRRNGMIDRGAVTQALEVTQASQDADIQRFGCQVIGSVCRGMDQDQDKRIQAAFDAGSLPVLLQALHSPHELVVSSALDALVSVSYGDGEAHAARAKQILDSGVVEWLVRHQRTSSVDDRRCCLAVIANIMLGSSWGGNAAETMENTVQAMIDFGVVRISMEVLRESVDDEVKISAGTCFSNIAHSYCGAKAVQPHLPAVIELLSQVEPDSHVRSMLLGAVGNAACFGDKALREYMVQLGVVDLLIPVMSEKASEAEYGTSTTQVFGNTPQSMVATIAIASLVGQEENNPHSAFLSSSAEVFQMFRGALTATLANQTFRHVHWSLHMILGTLANLSVHDGNKAMLLREGLVPLVFQALTNPDSADAALEQATRVIWNLSFLSDFAVNPDKYANGLHACLKRLTSHENQATRKNAVGALFQIRRQQHRQESSSEGVGSTPGGHIMLSYSWDNQTTALWVKRFLQNAGYRVWMDVDQMTSSTLASMAKAVEEAAVVLVFLSPSYKESEACRTEGEYAFNLKKPIIPIKVHDPYNATGWLGALIGSKLYFSFWQEAKFDSSGEALLEELRKHNILPAGSPQRSIGGPASVATDRDEQLVRAQKRAEDAEAHLRELQRQVHQLETHGTTELEQKLTALADKVQVLASLQTRVEALERRQKGCCVVS